MSAVRSDALGRIQVRRTFLELRRREDHLQLLVDKAQGLLRNLLRSGD